FSFWLELFLANPPHDPFDNSHPGGGLAARDQVSLQTLYLLVFSPAFGARFQMRPKEERLVAVQQPFGADDQIVPAFGAVHDCSMVLTVCSARPRALSSCR